jgi:hypothetical protein
MTKVTDIQTLKKYLTDRKKIYEKCDIPKYDIGITMYFNDKGERKKKFIPPTYANKKIENNTGNIKEIPDFNNYNGCLTFVGKNYGNLICFDIDNKNDTINIWNNKIKELNIDINTFALLTQSGGYHYYYRLTNEQDLLVCNLTSLDAELEPTDKSIFSTHIDIKYTNQVMIGMSKIICDEKLYSYKVINKNNAIEIPEKLFNELLRVYNLRHSKTNRIEDNYIKMDNYNDDDGYSYLNMDEEDQNKRMEELEEILSEISPCCDWKQWSHVGFCIYNKTGGTINGFNLFDKWSSGSKQYDKTSIKKEWDNNISKTLNKKNDKSREMRGYGIAYLKSMIVDNYEIQKKEFEKKYFYISKMGCYGYLLENGDILLKKKQIVLDEAKEYNYFNNKKGKKNTSKVNFFSKWLEDKNKLKYDNIVFDPQFKNKKDYNLFKGFKYDDKNYIPDNNYEKNIDFIKKIIRNIFKTDDEYNYFIDWAAHIIQKPHQKTNHAIILYSDLHGVGKNTIIELLTSIIGIEYTSKLSKLDDIDDRFNDNITRKILVYGDEINARARDKADSLKNLITQTIMKAEKKYLDPTTELCFLNLILTTNHEKIFFVESSDRRLFLVEIADPTLNKNDFIKFYDMIKQDEVKKAFHYFLKTHKISRDIVTSDPPMTKYKLSLIYENMPAYIQMIYTKHKDFINKSFSCQEIYEKSISYANLKKISTNFTMKKIGTVFPFFANKRKSNGNMIYKFGNRKELLDKLLKYDENYYKYIFDLESIDTKETIETETDSDYNSDNSDNSSEKKEDLIIDIFNKKNKFDNYITEEENINNNNIYIKEIKKKEVENKKLKEQIIELQEQNKKILQILENFKNNKDINIFKNI